MTTTANGTRLGHYEIERELGAGAMGEVLLARDLRLERQVALKSLPAAFADDEERLARFEREARMLAALHHSHVASIFGLEELDGRRYLVMEYVAGETLAQRMSRGAVDLGEALKLAEQIARGLAAAHDQGIIHRDLKPGNVMVTPDGGAKVVDFGLAKDVKRSAVVESGLYSDTRLGSAGDDPADEGAPSADDIALAPTVLEGSTEVGAGSTSDPLATEPGAVLGTAAYMSPEQARGQAVDRRSDVWAFGCVVFEMLTRRRPFEGRNLMQTLTAVLEKDPPWQMLPPYTPPAVERLLRRCLRKDPDERLRDLGDAALELRDIRSGHQPETASRGNRSPWAIVAAVLTGLVGAVGVLLFQEPAEPPPQVRFTLPTPDLQSGVVVESNLAVAPDGGSWVFRSAAGDTPRLMLRRLEDDVPIPIPGTEDAENPFFSPDGRHLGFTRGIQLLRTDPFKGSPRVLLTLDKGSFMGQPSWGDDGKILFVGLPQGVFVVDAEGGSPTSVLTADDVPGSTLLGWAEHVGSKHFAVFVGIENRQETHLVSIDGSQHRAIEGVASRVSFVEPDLLAYVRDREVLVQRLDLDAATLVGEPVRLASGVVWNSRTGNASFSLSESLLVVAQREYRVRMQWFDAATGEALEQLGEPADLSTPRISPKGDRVAVAVAELSGGAKDLWLFDLDRNVGSRLTHTTMAGESMVAWSPDGTHLAYYSDALGPPEVMIRSADAGGSGTALFDWDVPVFPTGWLADGSAVLLHSYPDADIYLAPLDGSPPKLWLQVAGVQDQARSSPDGTWLTFRSTELGASEVFAAPLDDPGRRIRISTSGGLSPAWAPDGRGIYFHDRRAVYRAALDTSRGRASAPETIVVLEEPDQIASLDVTPDGTRLLLAIVDESLMDPSTLVHVGWKAALGPGN